MVHAVREGRRQRVGDERALAASRHARDHGERAEGNLQRHVLQVVLRGARELERPAPRLAALLRHRDGAAARKVVRRERALEPHDLVGLAGRHHLAAVLARARPHVDDVVGAADGVLVVLHHDDGVAQIAQALERGDKPLVVALVQADGRLVQDVEHAHEARADLRGQADALRLAARERGRGPLEREVVQAHVHQEAQARLDLLHDGAGDVLLRTMEGQALEVVERVGRAHLGHVVDGLVPHRHGQDLGLQALAAARLARHDGEVLRQLLALVV